MINFDNIISKENRKYENPNPLFPMHPSRCVIFGPSSSGKTNDIFNAIQNSVFHKIFLYSKCLCEPKYEFLINIQKAKEEELRKKGINESLIHFSTDIKDVMPLESLDKSYQHLYIFDDLVLEDKKTQEKYIGDLYIRSRKYNASVFYLSQSYFKTPKIIRDNATFVVLKRLNDNRELKIIHSIYASEINREVFLKKYEESVSTYKQHGSFIIDNANKHKSLKLRANYTGIFC